MNRYTDLASHCIGLGRRKPYRRHGRTFYRPYRNRFACAQQDDDWECMVSAGYAVRRDIGHYVYYSMTRNGLDWLGGQLGMTIYDEE